MRKPFLAASLALAPAGEALMAQHGLDTVRPTVTGDAKQIAAAVHLP